MSAANTALAACYDRCTPNVFSVNFRTIIPLIIIAVVAIAATPVQAAIHVDSANTSSLTMGLVGYWPLDGSTINWITNTFMDISGNGYNATSTTMSTTSSPVAGKIGQALKFNGTNMALRTSNTNLSFSAYSYSFWVKARDAGGGTGA